MTDEWLTDIAFAHRGLHGLVTGPVNSSRMVENSLSAFRAANSRRHGIELDVLLSKDNMPVVFHDMTLERLTGRAAALQNFTASQLSQFTLSGSDDTIMTLAHILDNINQNYPVLIEIKGDQRRPVDSAVAVFNDIHDYSGPMAIMSFDPEIVLWFRDHAPTIVRGLVATSKNEGYLPDKYFLPTAQRSLVDTLKLNFIAYDIDGVPNEATNYCRENNIPVLTWTVRTKEQRRIAAEFCDNIIYEIPD